MKSKIEKLIELVGLTVEIRNLKRLDDGDLAHVGDAIIAGKEITRSGVAVLAKACLFDCSAGYYAIKQKMRSLNGYEYPAPETEAPEVGTPYYMPYLVYGACSRSNWADDTMDKARLEAGVVHLSEKNATAHAKAFIKAGGGEI